MKNRKLSLVDWAAITVLILPAVYLMMKFVAGFNLPYVSFEDKPLLYGIVLFWNASLGYLMFKK